MALPALFYWNNHYSYKKIDYSSFIIFLQNVAMQSRNLKNHNSIFVMTNFLHKRSSLYLPIYLSLTETENHAKSVTTSPLNPLSFPISVIKIIICPVPLNHRCPAAFQGTIQTPGIQAADKWKNHFSSINIS